MNAKVFGSCWLMHGNSFYVVFHVNSFLYIVNPYTSCHYGFLWWGYLGKHNGSLQILWESIMCDMMLISTVDSGCHHVWKWITWLWHCNPSPGNYLHLLEDDIMVIMNTRSQLHPWAMCEIVPELSHIKNGSIVSEGFSTTPPDYRDTDIHWTGNSHSLLQTVQTGEVGISSRRPDTTECIISLLCRW